MLIHQYDNATGQYISSHLADPDPRNEARWLVPAFSTAEPLPERLPRTWPVFYDGEWQLQPDHRGQMLYRIDTGEPAEIIAMGITPEDADLTTTPRPSAEHSWIDDHWQHDPQIVAEHARDSALQEFETRLAAARQANAGRADAYAAGLLNGTEAALFTAWAEYQMKLVRIVSAPSFPENLEWPSEPDPIEIERDCRLKVADALIGKATETGDTERLNLANQYRQALLDVIEQPGFPDDFVWPSVPEGLAEMLTTNE